MIDRALAGIRKPFRAVMGRPVLGAGVVRARLNGLAGEPLPEVEQFQQFGLVSAAPAGTQAIVLPLGGRTSAAVIVATESTAYRLELDAEGEMAIYNMDGDHVWLKRNGHIHVRASTKVHIDSPSASFSGDVSVGGNLAADGNVTDMASTTGKSMAHMRAIHNTHAHPENNINGGSTSPTPQVM
jgi:phage baseplate assembly protein V